MAKNKKRPPTTS